VTVVVQEALVSTLPADGSSPLNLMGDAGGPTVRRILLGSHLRRLREERGISSEQAGYAIRGSHSKISRIELGRVTVKQRDVADLLTHYGVNDPEVREALLSLASEAKKPGWWHLYGDVLPSWFEVYIGLEEAASVMRTYEVQFVPGLLQTEEYARALVQLGHPDAPAKEIEQRVNLRMARQQRLVNANTFKLWAIVDEAALLRPIGGRRAMRAQLEHLIAITELPHVTLQVMPLAAGGHAGCGGPFTILRFAEPELPDVVYIEQLTSAIYFDKPLETNGYMRVIDRLCIQAAQPHLTPQFLTNLVKEL
jgi:hypothetical protein